MTRTIRLGISPCPNDTFVFHALLERKVDTFGLHFEIELWDIEELNQRIARGDLDVSKASFAAALDLADRTIVLSRGAALGHGVGPILLARADVNSSTPHGHVVPPDARVLCPGGATTASLLYRLFHGGEGCITQVPFHEILPALAAGRADFGVCIHEARFTWRAHGVRWIEDLGATWEQRTGAPLPLGGILAQRALGTPTLDALDRAIAASLAYAHAHRQEALATMRRHAQEMDERVLWAHVELYVNEWTHELGREGARALNELSRVARASGLVASGRPQLAIHPTAPA